jgi:hypothetical protein
VDISTTFKPFEQHHASATSAETYRAPRRRQLRSKVPCGMEPAREIR